MILRVLDTETTGLKVEDSYLIEVAFVDIDIKTKDTVATFSSYINFQGEIPAMAKSINHIDESNLRNAPTLDQIAHIIYNDSVIPVAHNAAFDSMFLPDFDNEWLCTKLLAQQIWSGLESYSNQYLRYYLDLKIEGTGVHEALFDAKVTSELLKVILSEKSDSSYFELLELQAKSFQYAPFGKHKGEHFKDIPRGYLNWLMDNTDIAEGYRKEIEKVL